MDKLRIGVWLPDNFSPESGGGFGYLNQLISILDDIKIDNIEISYLSHASYNNSDIFHLKSYQKYSILLNSSKIASIKLKILNKLGLSKKTLRSVIQEVKDELAEKFDLIYFPTPICYFDDFPFIYTVWDLGHLNTYSFPEVTYNGCFESRQLDYSVIPFKALLILAESNYGKSEILNYLQINKDRIEVVPLLPSVVVESSISAIKPKSLKENIKFFHYPAQFWSHKNHLNLILAFNEFVKEYPNVKLILSGADKGNLRYILDTIKHYKLDDKVIYLGFITYEELKWLYLNSMGLIMPTLMGPSNMPLIEAAMLNCPVACSNINGHIEQLGDYGIYFDALDHLDIKKSMITLINRENKMNFITFKNYNEIAKDRLKKAFIKSMKIRSCWGKNDKIF